LSSILKALKKVEVETSDPNDVLSSPEGLDTRAAIRRRARDGRYPMVAKVLAALFGCAVLLAVGWYFMPVQKMPDQSPVVAGAPAERPAAALPAVRERQPMQGQKMRSPERPAREKSIARTPQRRPRVSGQPLKPAAVQRPPVEPATATRTEIRPKTGDIPVLSSEQGKLTLQAISWAQNSSGRMAVINGQIVREGGAVDGFTVTDIGPDEVVVRKGTEDWRLIFGLKSP